VEEEFNALGVVSQTKYGVEEAPATKLLKVRMDTWSA
jgi:hypothetical protein